VAIPRSHVQWRLVTFVDAIDVCSPIDEQMNERLVALGSGRVQWRGAELELSAIPGAPLDVREPERLASSLPRWRHDTAAHRGDQRLVGKS